jgi:transposase
MTRKRRYRAVVVKKVDVNLALSELAEGPIWVGLDVAKEEVFAVVRDASGAFLRPWKAKQPAELNELVGRFKALAEVRPLVVVLESTGTYGDALRQAMTDAGLEVHRVSGKAKSDYEEIFDGVPSAHDGKDAAIIAELAALGKSCPWPHEPPSEEEAAMAAWVDWLDAQQDVFQVWLGRLEGLLARHWPEATRILGLSSITLIRVLAEYGGPVELGEDAAAAEQLRRWGGPWLKEQKIAALCGSAKTTVGVRMTKEDQRRMKCYAREALQAHQEVCQAKRRLKELSEQDETVEKMAHIVGSATACVLRASVGNPADFHCGEAYRKAMGLNLKERSSGKHKGKLKITKRGPSIARRWLYFAALRIVQQPPVRRWYEAKKKRDGGWGGRAVIAVMRKLALAIWSVVVRGQPFELWRLFPGRPLPQGAAA